MKNRYKKLTDYLYDLLGNEQIALIMPHYVEGNAYLRICFHFNHLDERDEVIENICETFGSNEMIPHDEDIILRLI